MKSKRFKTLIGAFARDLTSRAVAMRAIAGQLPNTHDERTRIAITGRRASRALAKGLKGRATMSSCRAGRRALARLPVAKSCWLYGESRTAERINRDVFSAECGLTTLFDCGSNAWLDLFGVQEEQESKGR